MHLLHGRIGSGKTTFAKRLARETGAVRLTHDERMRELYGVCPPEPEYRQDFERVVNQLWAEAAAVDAGTDVIMDYGFRTRASRNDARQPSAGMGAQARFCKVECPAELARECTLRRSEQPDSHSLWIDAPAWDKLNSLFEPMQSDEGFVVVTAEGDSDV